MKKLTIITTIVLMLAFVLPMAQAQDKPATESSSAETVKAEDQASQSTVETEAELKLKQNQEELSQNLQELEIRLQQLQIQKQKLEKELQAMVQAKQAEVQVRQAEVQARQAEVQARQAEVQAAQAKIKAKEAALKTKAEVKQWEQHAQKMIEWAQQYATQFNSPEFQKQINNLENNAMVQWANSDEFKQWQKEMKNWSQQWAESDEFKQWEKDMQQWGKEFAEAHEEYTQAHEEAKSGDHDHTAVNEPHPMHPILPMPAMPPMPPMPAMPPMPVNADVSVLPVVGPPEVAPPAVLPVLRSSGTNDAKAPILPGETASTGRSAQDVEVKMDKDGKFVATRQMQFVSKVKPGCPFVIRNSLGNIILKPSKDGNCDVKAIIRAKAKTEAEARAKAEQVGMTVNSTEERYYLKPVKPDGDKWNNVNVDFYIAVPVGVRPDVKTDLGNIDLSDLKGEIKAVTNLGNVKAVNTAGNVNLRTELGKVEFIAPKDMAAGDVKLFSKMGDIVFTAPRDLSAKLQVETKMGEIKSELPLEINISDMFKRTTEGTIGAGGATIKMNTDMGKISLKWQSSPQVEVKF